MFTIAMDEAVEPLIEKRQTWTPEVSERDILPSARRPSRTRWLLSLLLSLLLVLGLFLVVSSRGFVSYWRPRPTLQPTPTATSVVHETASFKRDVATASATAAAQVLENFQVAQPVLMPEGATASDGQTATSTKNGSSSPCSVVLMDYVFANSYGAPFIGELS